MKSFLIIIAVGLSTTFGVAQEGKINIQQDQKIADLLKIYKHANSTSEYYRIQVGFGTLSKAERIKSEVEQDFPELSAQIYFAEPTYRVRVGKFKNKLTAERKFLEVRSKYPQAMLLNPKKSTK